MKVSELYQAAGGVHQHERIAAFHAPTVGQHIQAGN
jgi:hypothetical protein